MNCNICDSSTKNIFQNNVNISISSDSQIIEENLNIYKCDKCGLEINRDFNASINLSNYSRA